MINMEPIALYNKTRAYVKKEFYTYDDKEMQSIKEAAPLLKFTMHKQTLKIEEQNVEELLQLAEFSRAQLVIISRTKAQYLVHADAPDVLRSMSASDMFKYFRTPTRVNGITLDRMMEIKMCNYWDRYDGVLMEGSTRSGMYVHTGPGKFYHIKTANTIVRKLYEHGYIAMKGRVPMAVEPQKFGMHDIEELNKMLNFCTNENMRGVWMRQVAQQFDRTIRDYRWPTRSELELKVKRFIRR
jgi:hypothetical protein